MSAKSISLSFHGIGSGVLSGAVDAAFTPIPPPAVIITTDNVEATQEMNLRFSLEMLILLFIPC